jgi:hypothetical protein
MHGPQTLSIQTAVSMALILAAGGVARADGGISTSISGYGTLGGTFTSDNNYAYVHDSTEFTGATHQLDVPLESRIGVQAVIDFGSGFTVTAQELAKQRGSDDFSLGTEWLYLQYSPDPDWRLRIGRVALATFLFSDSRDVGYAAPWFRAPNEIYSAEPYSNLDGGQVLWHHNIGAVGIGLQGSYGNTTQSTLDLGVVENVKVTSMYNLSATLQYGDFLLRVARTTINLPVSFQVGPINIVNFNLRDNFTSLGLQYDNGKAIVLSEFAKRTENDFPYLNLPAQSGLEWYVAGGWRFGKLTPLLSYGAIDPNRSFTEPAGSFGTWSASLRYDVVRNVALKAEVSRAQAGNGAYWVTPNPASSERVNVYSFGVDFVF